MTFSYIVIVLCTINCTCMSGRYKVGGFADFVENTIASIPHLIIYLQPILVT